MRPVFITLLALGAFLEPLMGQDTMAGFMEEDYSCIMCHTEMRSDFLEGVHSSRGIQCTDCHGGDPTQFEAEQAHTQGFSGGLSKSQAVTLCLSCHGNLPQMRQYALEPVTRDMFLVSRHGQRLLLEGDTLAPSCSDCHGSHAILPRSDPRSMVYPARIPETCSACHSDPDRVLPGMPTSQYEEWAGSATASPSSPTTTRKLPSVHPATDPILRFRPAFERSPTFAASVTNSSVRRTSRGLMVGRGRGPMRVSPAPHATRTTPQ